MRVASIWVNGHVLRTWGKRVPGKLRNTKGGRVAGDKKKIGKIDVRESGNMGLRVADEGFEFY